MSLEKPKLNVGKRFASGTANSGTQIKTYQSGNRTDTSGKYAVTVNGLTFKPRVILLYRNEYYWTIYFVDHVGYEITVLENRIYDDGYRLKALNNTTYKIDGTNIYVNETGFSLPSSYTSSGNVPHTWIAYE